MNDHMMFPHDWAVFLEDYSFRDNEEVYTNGARLIPTFRVEQMMGHYLPKAAEESKPRWIPVTERLPHFSPNKWRKVLVTLEDNSGKRFTTTAKYHEEYEYWYELADCRYADFKVIAWMEKPAPYEPPKEVSE